MRFGDDFVRLRTRHMPREAGARLRTHYDEIGVRFSREAKNFRCRITNGHAELDLAPGLCAAGHQLLQLMRDGLSLQRKPLLGVILQVRSNMEQSHCRVVFLPQ